LPAFLLTWNPNNYPFHEVVGMAAGTAAGRSQVMRWSTGSRQIRPNDRLFLLRQAEEPRGLVAAGWALGEAFEADHFDPAKAGEGKKKWYIMGRYDRVLDPAVTTPLPTDFASGPLVGVHWRSQLSGILIPADAADQLEQVWAEHIGAVTRAAFETEPDPEADQFPEGRVVYRLHRQRERDPRVVEQAKALARERHGRVFCEACGFDFEAAYGDLGRDFIEGHHTRPLSSYPGEQETRAADIALVCSNCHRMLHRRRPWLGPDELGAVLRGR
jgi:hypothetical protein